MKRLAIRATCVLLALSAASAARQVAPPKGGAPPPQTGDSDELSFGGAVSRVAVPLAFEAAPAGERGFVSDVPLEVAVSREPTWTSKGLPPLRSAQALFGTLRLGRGGKIAFVLDQSDPTGRVHDRLYLDRNRDFDLSNDGEPALGVATRAEERGGDYLEFTAVPIDVYYGENRTEPFRLTLYSFLPRSGPLEKLFAIPASWRAGAGTLDGVAARVLVFDADGDAMFDLEGLRWALLDAAEKAPASPTLAPAAVPIRLRGVPYKIVGILQDGSSVHLVQETEANTREAELAGDPVLSEPPRARAAETVSWLPSIAAAGDAVKTRGKTLFVLFAADWSRASTRLVDRTLWDAEVVKLLNEKFAPVRIDPSRDEVLAKRYEVTALPTMLLINAEGEVVERIVGYRQARTLADLLRRWRN